MIISIVLQALTGSFITDLDRASKATKKRFADIEKSAIRVGKQIGVALLAGAAGAAIAFKAAVDRADALNKAASQIGITTEALSRLEFAAKQSDIQLDQLTAAFVKMTKFQAESIDTNSEAAFVFEKFGISAKDAAGNLRKGEDVFRDFVGVLSKLDAQTRNAIGLKIFGKSFVDLVPLIEGGTQQLDAFAAESDRIGNTLSTETGKRADEFNDKLDSLKDTINGLTTKLAADLLPTLTDLVNELQEASRSGEALRTLESVFQVIGNAAKVLGGIVQVVVDTIQSLVSIAAAAWEGERAQLALLTGDFDKAQAHFANAKREFNAAIEAGAETRRNLGIGSAPAAGAAAPNTRGGEIQFIDPPAFDPGAAAAKKAAAAILDADNEKRRQAAAASAAKAAATKAEAAADKAAAEAAREHEKALDDLHDKLEKIAEASAEFKTRLEDMTAEQEGPLSVSNLQYQRELADLKQLHKESEGTASDLAKAEGLLAQAHAADVAEIEKSLNPGEERLKQMREELRLLGLQTDAERIKAEFLADNKNSTQAQAEEAAQLAATIEKTREQIALADDLRDAFADAFAGILDGSKTVKEAFSDLADSIISMIARMIAQDWVTKLFGAPGTTGAGSAGGGILSWLSGFLPGRALGGPVLAGSPYLVGERGPELIIPRSAGTVIPNNQLSQARAGVGNVINISVQGSTTRETAQQIAMKVSQALQFAGRAA